MRVPVLGEWRRVQKSNLQKDLQKEWMDTTLFKGKYKVVSGKKVQIAVKNGIICIKEKR